MNPIRQKWKATMTDRERFNGQMHYRPVDRCFNREFGYWQENYEQWKIFTDNGIKSEEQADRFFNFDRMITFGTNTWMSHSMPELIVEQREHTLVRRNGEGVLEEVGLSSSSSIPHYIGSSVQTPQDWIEVKKEYFDPAHPCRFPDFEKLDRIAAENPDVPLGINCGSMIGKVRDMLTFEGLCYACYDYPDMVEDMVETCCVLVEQSLDRLLPRYTFDYASGWEDICFKNGPIVSVEFFREVVAPRYGRIHKKLKQYGVDIWYMDCDGDVRPILKYFMDNGVNCLFPYEVNSCCHPAELFAEYGKDLRIMGGFDKMALIAGRDAIRDYMKSLEACVARGGYIPFCDHRCPPDVNENDYLYYLDLKEKTFGLK